MRQNWIELAQEEVSERLAGQVLRLSLLCVACYLKSSLNCTVFCLHTQDISPVCLYKGLQAACDRLAHLASHLATSYLLG
jgi:hypothetical protein